MAISNIPMPSFTLVLTSGHRSHRRHPNVITFDTCALLPSAPDHLMKTIDLRDELEDYHYGHHTDVSATAINQEDVDLPAIFKQAELSSSGTMVKDIKANLLLFLHKFVFKRKSALVEKMASST